MLCCGVCCVGFSFERGLPFCVLCVVVLFARFVAVPGLFCFVCLVLLFFAIRVVCVLVFVRLLCV